MSNYDSIVFDLDGTLWDASESCAVGWNAALEKERITDRVVSADDIRVVSGLPFNECVSSLFGSLPSGDLMKLGEMIEVHEKDAVKNSGGEFYEGVLYGLEMLANRYRLFLVSNCQSWYLQEFWKHSETSQFFVDQDCHGDSGNPKAQMIAGMVEWYELSQAVYIGDTVGDKRSSQQAGVAFGHASYGFGSVEAADMSFASFSEIVARFRGESAA